MSKTRFTQWIVLACMGTLAACTSGGDTAGTTELNIIVPADPSGTGTPSEIDIGTVEYTIDCAGGEQPGFLDNAAAFTDAVQISGNLEVVDGRPAPPGSTLANSEIWQGFMDLPPGPCTVQLRARDDDGEVICTATEPFSIAADSTTKVDIILICDISFQAPVGMLDVDGTFSFNVGNFCPNLFVLNCAESNPVPPLPGIPPTTYCEVRYEDGDSTCGDNCDPQACTPTPAGLTCVPGPDPGVSTTITCDSAGLMDCEGDFVFDPSCSWGGGVGDVTGEVGAGIPVPVLLGGPGPNPGGFFVACNPGALPGSTVTCTAVTTDGDIDCDKTKQVQFNCPGLNFCDQVAAGDNLTDCDDGNECTTDSCDRTAQACVNANVPAGGGNNCDSDPGPGTAPGECDGAGVCGPFGCLTDGDCDSATTPCLVAPPGACDVGTGLCAPEVPGNDGASCDSGVGSGIGTCGGGICNSSDLCAIGPDCNDANECTQDECSGAPLVCSNPPEPNGTPCDAGGGPGSGACDGAGNCAAPPVIGAGGGVSNWRALPKVCDIGVFDATAFSFACTTFRSPPVDIPGGGTANAFCSGTPSGCPAAGCEVPSATLAGQLAVDVFLDFDVTSDGAGNLTHNYTVNAVNAALGIAAAIANLVDITVFSDVISGVPAQLVNVLDPTFANTTLGLYVVAGTTLVLDNEIPAVTTAVVPTSSPNVALNFSGNFLLELFLTTAGAPLNVDSSACTFDIVGSDVILPVL